MRFSLALMTALAICGFAWTTAASSQEPERLAGEQTSTPQAADRVSDLYPVFAHNLNISGSATLQCSAFVGGVASECLVIDETPFGLGFGAAALKAIQGMPLDPQRIDGLAEGAAFKLHIPFSTPPLSSRDEASTWSGPEPTSEQLATALRQVKVVGVEPFTRWLNIDDLAEDRRETVRAWVEDLLPDQEGTEAIMALAVARLMLQKAARGETGFNPAPEEFMVAMGTPEIESAKAELKRRYCEAYDCGSEGLLVEEP